MPRLRTMTTLVTRCKQRADLENARHIAPAEWKALISEQYGDLYSVVCDAGLQYFEYTFDITSDGSDSYDEPEDHLSTISLDQVYSDGRRRPIREIMAQERSRWAGRGSGDPLVFAHVDDLIYFYRTPTTGLEFELLYIPQPPDLAEYADGEAIDVVTADGEAFLIWGVAVKALAKSESDVRLAMAEREAARARLLDWAVHKMLTQPRRRVVDEFDASDVPISDADWRFNR
jgi:hypothetical protein